MSQKVVHTRHAGFTLVELLVVISIIALLIAILLPSLGKARDQAKTVVCGTRIKGILNAMHLYANEENGFIVGSANTSGSVLFTKRGESGSELATLPSWPFLPTQVFDWAGAMYRQMNMRMTNQTLTERFEEIRRNKAFQCVSNKFTSYGIDDAYPNLVGPMISYNTSRNFLYPANRALMASKFPNPTNPGQVDTRWDTVQGGQSDGIAGGGVGWVPFMNPDEPAQGYNEQMPPGYVPMVDKVGAASGKVFIADGCRWTTNARENSGPDYDGNVFAGWGGAFADLAPYHKLTRSWNRSFGDPDTPAAAKFKDVRIYSYRHGTRTAGGRWGLYRMNVGFYDAHVETMNDSNSANPHMWIPSGGKLRVRGQNLFKDVIARWTEGEGTILRIR